MHKSLTIITLNTKWTFSNLKILAVNISDSQKGSTSNLETEKLIYSWYNPYCRGYEYFRKYFAFTKT